MRILVERTYCLLLRSSAQMLWNVRDDDARSRKQSCFQAKRRLIVQWIFPPVGHHKFGQNDRQGILRMQLMHRINIGQQGTSEGSIWRLNHDELRLLIFSEILLQMLPLGTHQLKIM